MSINVCVCVFVCVCVCARARVFSMRDGDGTSLMIVGKYPSPGAVLWGLAGTAGMKGAYCRFGVMAAA